MISIITASFNSKQHIEQTIDTVRRQVGVEFEHIVVDGGSVDGTQDILRKLQSDKLRWISEPDRGIADAMNKGVPLSRGEWLLFLQSDDYLVSDSVLQEAARHFHDRVDICAFPILYGDAANAIEVKPRGVGFWMNFKSGINHQGSFIRRSLFNRIGNYDTDFKIAMDYEYFLRANRAGASFELHRGPIVAFMRDSGISGQLDWPNLERRFSEEKMAHRKHQSRALVPLYDAWWACYPSYRRWRNKLIQSRP